MALSTISKLPYNERMLPNFPDVVEARGKINRAKIKTLVRSKAPMLGQIASHIVYEGATTDIIRDDGSAEETPMQQHSANIVIKVVPISEFTLEAVDHYLDEIAEQFAKSMSQAMHETISDAADKSGNVVDGQGQPISFDLLLEAFEKIQIDFNDDGTWSAPSIVVSPQQFERIMALDKSPEAADYKRKLDNLIEVKRAEYNRREANRVLAG